MGQGWARTTRVNDVEERLRSEAQEALLRLRGTMDEDRRAATARLEKALQRLHSFIQTGQVAPEEPGEAE